MDQDKETEIIRLIQKGERDHYRLLVEKYKGPIFNLAYRMIGNYQDADDMAQEAFMKAYEAMGRFDSKRRFYPWLYTIAINRIRNHLKKKRPFFTEPNDSRYPVPEGQSEENPEYGMVKRQEMEKVVLCFQKLPLTLREALVLRFYQDFSFEDISDILDISLSSAKMRVYRGLEKLRLALENG